MGTTQSRRQRLKEEEEEKGETERNHPLLSSSSSSTCCIPPLPSPPPPPRPQRPRREAEDNAHALKVSATSLPVSSKTGNDNDHTKPTGSRRRRRRSSSSSKDGSTTSSAAVSSSSLSAFQEFLLSLRWCGTRGRGGPPAMVHGGPAAEIARCVMEGNEVESRYGCHAHVYDTVSPHASHGTALVWSVSRASLNAFSLLTLCRVGNAARKKVILVDEQHCIGIGLQYTAVL